jgi:SRSO17 transposase
VKTTRQIYCQYLLSSQINYTCTNLADHVDNLDHNSVYRYLKNEKLTPRLVWEKARQTLEQTADGYIIFDDTVADKSHSHEIEGVRRQYSGNVGGVVKGIGIVTCVYYNASADRFWVIDYRIFDPDREWTAAEEQTGKTVKLKGFAGATRLKLFRVAVSTNRTEYLGTNEMTQSDVDAAQKESGHRWKIEQFHREAKQTTGLEHCQCRLNRSQRNHIAAATLVWLSVKELADKTKKTVYQLKQGLLSDYLIQQMRNPTIAFS